MGLKICPCALCFIILVGFSSSVQFSSSPYAVTGEAYLFVGEDLRLYCTLSEEFLQNFNASDISFTFQYQTEANTTCVPASDVHIVDSNVAMLIIHNITFQNVGPYSCYVGGPYCHDQYSKDSQYVGVSDDISIEYSPQNVTNFKCVLYNWDEFMNCTWQHPVEYRNVENIKVTTIYAVARDISAECPKETNTSCTWYKENLRLARIYYVQVNVINTKNNATATSLFWFKPFALVKPEPVQNLKIIAVSEESPGCLLLSWSHARIFRNKVYRIKHQNETDKEFYVLYDNLTETNMTICGYLPYTFQNFSVECYPTSGYWSEPVYAGNTTPMIAPSEGPHVTNGSFTSTPCVGSQRKVVLMWQEVEVSAQNGIIDGYLIKSGETDLANVTANTYSATVDIPCYSASELHIFAHNKGGYSQKPAVLVIHPVTVILSKKVQESFSVEIVSSLHGDYLRAQWEDDERPEHRNYTVFWCQYSSDKSCMGQINWMIVAGSRTDYDLPIDSSKVGEYMFGISVTDTQTDRASAIFWTWCLFRHNYAMQHTTVNSLTVNSGINEVQVSWSQIPCSYQSMIKVTNYTVKWCQTTKCNETGEVFTFAVPAVQYMYTVSDLKASVKYSFTVQPVSYKDVGDEVRPWKVAVPVESDTSTPLLPVLVGVFVPLVFILMVAFMYRKCQQSMARTKKLELASREFFTLENSVPQGPAPHPPGIPHSPSSSSLAVRLLSLKSITSISSSDSECDLETVSPQITNQNLSSLYSTQDGRTCPDKSVCFNSNSTESYRRVAESTLSESVESSGKHQESVSPINSQSIQSYQRLGYSQSNPSAGYQTQSSGYQTGVTEKPREHFSMTIVDCEDPHKRKVASVPDKLDEGNTMTQILSTVLQPGYVTLSALTDTESDLDKVSSSIPEITDYLPHSFSSSKGPSAGTSSFQPSTSDAQNSDDTRIQQSTKYIHMKTLRSLSTDSENSS